MKKQKKTILLVVAIVLIGVVLGFVLSQNSSEKALKKQLDLGFKFLTEQDYEQAIINFKKAIEIDPMSSEAYLGLADAYVGNGDFETAISTLEDAIKFFEENGQDATVLKDKLTTVRMERQVREEEEKLAAIPFVALHLDTIRNIALLKGKPILDYTRAELFNVGKSHCNYFDSEEWHRVENGETWPDETPKPNTGVSARDDYFIEEKAYVSIRDVGITIIKSDSSFSLDGDNYVAWDMISYPYTGISDECESLIGTDLDDFLKTIGAPDANTIETTGMLLGDVEGTYLMGDVYSNGNLSITIQTKENDTTYRLTLDTEKMDGINKIKRIDFDIM